MRTYIPVAALSSEELAHRRALGNRAEYRARKGRNQAAYWRRHPTVHARHADAIARERERAPEKYAAREAVGHAVATGRLVRGVCAVCGTPETQGHHANGYGPEHVLDVVWLCTQHHAEAHRAV